MSDESARFNTRLWQVWKQLNPSAPKGAPVMPPLITGQLFNVDHTPASGVLVIVRRPAYQADPQGFRSLAATPWPKPSCLTDSRGAFALALPSFPLPEKLFFDVLAKDHPIVTFSVCGFELLDGLIGPIVLNVQLQSFTNFEAKALRSATAPSMVDRFHRSIESASNQQNVQLGESDCAEQFYSQTGPLEEFPYGILFRLVEPEVSSVSLFTPSAPALQAAGKPTGSGGSDTSPTASKQATVLEDLARRFLKSIPGGTFVENADPTLVSDGIKVAEKGIQTLAVKAKEAIKALGDDLAAAEAKIASFLHSTNLRQDFGSPIDVVAFKRQLSGIERDPITLAGTLGLGYILQCKQVWLQGGLTLGDLIYSLPLAPGESQLLAIREVQQSSTFREEERGQASEQQQAASTNDSSSTAIFSAAFREAAQQASQYSGTSRTVGGGGSSSPGFLGGLFGGSSSASSSSETNTSGSFGAQQNLSRDYASAASQRLSASVSRSASATRSSTRTLIRIASQNEKDNIVTKSVANNNHCHALTIQYWEVLRQISIRHEISGLQLVCLIPLGLITFTADDQIVELPYMTAGGTGAMSAADFYSLLLKRYDPLIQYLDPIASVTPDIPQYSNAFDILRHLRLEPPSSGDALPQDDRTLTINITGGFIPQDQLSVNVLYKKDSSDALESLVADLYVPVPSRPELDQLQSTQAYLDTLRQIRQSSSQSAMPAVQIKMPPGVNYQQLISLVVSVKPIAHPIDIKLKPAIPIESLVPLKLDDNAVKYFSTLSQSVGADDITKCGPATLFSAQVSVRVKGHSYPILSNTSLPLPASDKTIIQLDSTSVPLAISKDDLKDVEALYRYVKANRVRYSRAVWESFSRDEWAILLERYEIQFTNQDPSMDSKDKAVMSVPLLNCVANQLLGIEGNLAIFPISLPIVQPRNVAAADPKAASDGEIVTLTHSNLTNLLLERHINSFRAMPSVITLPTHGMLGEGVLGKCNSCEKIDLTRFWNWKDSPIPIQAPQITGIQFASQKEGPVSQTQTPSGGVVPGIITINTGDAPAATPLISDLLAKATGLTDSKVAENPTIKALQDLVGQTESRTIDRAKDAMATSKELSNKAMDVFQALATEVIKSGEKATEAVAKAAPAEAAM